jgi:hypothetical protein
MSILDVTEDQIFHTLGRGRDPNFKPIEKVRPIVQKPNKSYTINRTVKPAQIKTVQQVVQHGAESLNTIPALAEDDPVKKLTADVTELNNRVVGLQKLVKWYVVPQFVVVLALVLALIVKS